ncbi:nuclear transport factor 2 family protein [Phocaeicola coprocola]|uniref:nuclear transport factor 2 family protein n=1 Tax=Phocaeicola coprocola TaxID=310298 RepID=UPI002943C99E|nr:nuclear transport factor 2 family protein [Phocaeicola coprocola]
MKLLIITTFMLLALTVGVNAQKQQRVFTTEEQVIVDLSNNKWDWMAEKNVDKLAELFHENSQFVHMGGYWGKQQELETIRTGGIWYKKAEIHDVQVKFAAGTATVYSRIHLNSVVGGNSVRFPFIVTEVYVMENGKWQLSSLAFTKTLGE